MDKNRNGLCIKVLVVGYVQTNCYIVGLEDGERCLLVDPGGEPERIIRKLEDLKWKPEGILLTHGHFDHILGVRDVQEKYGAKLYVQEEEKELLKDKRLNCSDYLARPEEYKADVLLKDGEAFSLAGFDIRVLHTPGHTRGSACYLLRDYSVLFSGDTLFLESIGRTDLPTGSGNQILNSIRNALFQLDDDVDVYPGHGEKTTIGYEKRNNPYV